MTFVELNDFVYVNITDTITVCHQERFIAHIFLYAFDTTSCHRVIACVNDGDFPRLKVTPVNCHVVGSITEVKTDIRIIKEIVGKPLLDILLLVAGTDDEFIMPEERVLLHYVP